MYTTNKKLFIVLALIFVFMVCSLIALLYIFKKTEVNIGTQPFSATYTVKGMRGTTPSKIMLHPGKYEIEITKDSFEAIKTSFEVPFFGNKINLLYTLKRVSLKEGDKPSSKETIEKTINDYSAQFPYASLLPIQKETFYISRPSNDGLFNIYINKNNESQAKQDVYAWFRTQGVKSPESLKINWKYSK